MLNPADPPTNCAAPSSLSSQNPITASFHKNQIFNQSLGCDIEGKLVPVKLPEKANLFMR
jgi:hypothetical protein